MKLFEVEFSKLAGQLNKLREDEGVNVCLGTMIVSKGILVALFSARLNGDFFLIIPDSDQAKVIQEVKGFYG